MKRITRYLLREHVGPLLFAASALTSLLLLNYISKRFQDLVGKGLPWNVIAEFFLLSVPFVIAMTLPMAVLIATLYAFSRMAADNELTAMMSCGVSTRRLMLPVVGASLALSIAMVGFNDQILPRANLRLNSLSLSITQKKPTLALKAQLLNEVSRNRVYMWMSRLESSRNTMYGVTIYDLNDPTMHRTIIADSGWLAFAPNQRDLRLTLFDGHVQETRSGTPDRFQRTYFRTDVLKVPEVANSLSREGETFKGDREMTICEMQGEIAREQGQRDSTRMRLAAVDSGAVRAFAERYGSRIGAWYCRAIAALGPKAAEAQGTQGPGAQGPTPQAPPLQVPGQQVQLPRLTTPSGEPLGNDAQVKALSSELERSQFAINRYEVEIHKKFAISLACLVFALIGPPIAMRFPRAGVGLTIGVSLTVFAAYYVGLIAGEKLADDGYVSPAGAMWGVDAILALVALPLLWRMGYNSGARSNALLEFFDRVLRRAPRGRRT